MKMNINSMRKLIPVLLLAAAGLMLLSGCARQEDIASCVKGTQYGFWGGLWHGIIAPVDLVIMLFKDDVAVYAPNNNGAWYAFGFILGSGGWGFLGGNRSKKRG